MWEQSPGIVKCCVHVITTVRPLRRMSRLQKLSPPALQTDYPGKSPLLHKYGTSNMEFHGKMRNAATWRRSNSLLIHVEKIGKLLYFDWRIWIGHKGLMNLSPGTIWCHCGPMFWWVPLHPDHPSEAFSSLTPGLTWPRNITITPNYV